MRKFWTWLEFWFLLLAQLVCIGWYLTMLFPAAAQTPTVPISQSQPAKLGAFLDQYPIKKEQPTFLAEQPLWRLGEGAFTGVRVFKTGKAIDIAANAQNSFAGECNAAGGQIQYQEQIYDIVRRYQQIRAIRIETAELTICASGDKQVLGALVAGAFYVNYNRHVRLFVLNEAAAARMVEIYHQALAREARSAAMLAEQQAEWHRQFINWRKSLAIGSETNCGPVLGIRSDMIEVANGGQPYWFRRDALFPVGARDRTHSLVQCGSTDAN
jgi:hypothetical protein